MTCAPNYPVTHSLCTAPPFTDRCYRCDDPAFVEPVYRFATVRGKTRCVYKCPRCRHSWWVELDTPTLGDDYARAGWAA